MKDKAEKSGKAINRRRFLGFAPMAGLALMGASANADTCKEALPEALTDREGELLAEFCKSQLKHKVRYLVMMRHFENLTFREIGAILGLPGALVRRLYAQAIVQLQAYLKRTWVRWPGESRPPYVGGRIAVNPGSRMESRLFLLAWTSRVMSTL